MLPTVLILSLCFVVALQAAGNEPVSDDLLTVAEQSDYTATATYDEVMGLLHKIAEKSDRGRLTTFGESVEGRALPLLILADPPVSTPEEARASGKLTALLIGNIHAGEVCGKEALLMLARAIVMDPNHPLLHDFIILIAPIYNADGNERVAPVEENRPGQIGPERVGIRPNAQGLDLNRDWIKLEAPESRAMVKMLTEWDPHLTIDTHTTNGSHHRYVLTYGAPLNPSAFSPSIEFVRDQLLPTVTERMRKRTGYDTFFYGNFNRDHTQWATYSADPRFGGPYQGLRGQMSILSEAYSYAPYRDRVLSTLEFTRECLVLVAEHRDEVAELHERARHETISAGANPQPDDVVGLRHRIAAFDDLVTVRGYVMETDADGRLRPTDQPHDYQVVHLGRFEPMVSVVRPAGYVFPRSCGKVIAKLRQHGITVEPFDGAIPVEEYTVTAINRAERAFQGHQMLMLEVIARDALYDASHDEGGAVLVRTAQPLGTLAVYLLEPQSTDGLAAWNFLDDHLKEGEPFPIRRVHRARNLP